MNVLHISSVAIAAAITTLAASANAQRTPTTESTRDATRSTTTALPAGITSELVNAHVISPVQLRSVTSNANETRETLYKLSTAARTFTSTPRLDVAAFGLALHTVLKDNATGYVLQVRQNGSVIHNGIWEWAQKSPDPANGWTLDTRMHVASVSKFLTAVGLVKLLDAKGISLDARIFNYLPDYWTRGSNVDDITFRHLLTHRSGFSTGGSASDYDFMKGRYAAGVTSVGTYDYENMNFGLMRILIPIIEGKISKSATFMVNEDVNDKAWDAVTLLHFRNYMQQAVFSPAGVSNVNFKPITGMANAFAYFSPETGGTGWNSGDLSTMAGGAAFRMSVKELLNVMDHVRRRNTIIPATRAQYMLDNLLGIDQALDTPAGKIYNKNGRWNDRDCAGGCRTEQSVAYFLPNGIEVALLVNSPIGSENFSLRGLVRDVYVSTLTQ